MALRRPATVGDGELLAKYPFLPGAEALVESLGPSLRELIVDPVYARARELGRERIRVAADDPTGGRRVEELSRATPEERFLSFYYARLLLASASTPAPLRRWAVAEAKQSSGEWRSAPREELGEIATRLGFPLEPAGADVSFRLPDYLKLATPIREGDFRLVRQGVRDGTVRVNPDRAARLLQEAVRLTLAVPVAVTDEVRDAIRESERDFLTEVAQRIPLPVRSTGPGSVGLKPDVFPPCIRKMQRMLQAGENLSHAGRFALAAFLHRVGADFETIVDAYRGAPDFDESITRYQVEHITQRDGGAGYSPPECETLRSHGLCFRDGDPASPAARDHGRDPLCYETFLRHPLQYYRIRVGAVKAEAEYVPPGADGTRTSRERPR